jgi:hypothetical protein
MDRIFKTESDFKVRLRDGREEFFQAGVPIVNPSDAVMADPVFFRMTLEVPPEDVAKPGRPDKSAEKA